MSAATLRHVLAYNLVNFMRTLPMPKKTWPLNSLRERQSRLARRLTALVLCQPSIVG
jgi:hypothetical protein